ncbi:MAG: hypothetical protein R3C14_16080 [Caldilineaceae bacterium]
MAEKLLTEMSYDEVGALMDSFIERSSQESGEMPAKSFFELLFAQVAQRVQKTLEVEGRIVDGQLVFTLPKLSGRNFYVQDNQIVIGEQRIVVKLTH